MNKQKWRVQRCSRSMPVYGQHLHLWAAKDNAVLVASTAQPGWSHHQYECLDAVEIGFVAYAC